MKSKRAVRAQVQPVVRCADCGFLIALHDEYFVSIGIDFMCSHGYAPHFLIQKYGRNFGCRSGKSA